MIMTDKQFAINIATQVIRRNAKAVTHAMKLDNIERLQKANEEHQRLKMQLEQLKRDEEQLVFEILTNQR